MTRCNHHTFLLPANYVQWFNLSYIPSATEKSTLLKKKTELQIKLISVTFS